MGKNKAFTKNRSVMRNIWICDNRVKLGVTVGIRYDSNWWTERSIRHVVNGLIRKEINVDDFFKQEIKKGMVKILKKKPGAIEKRVV